MNAMAKTISYLVFIVTSFSLLAMEQHIVNVPLAASSSSTAAAAAAMAVTIDSDQLPVTTSSIPAATSSTQSPPAAAFSTQNGLTQTVVLSKEDYLYQLFKQGRLPKECKFYEAIFRGNGLEIVTGVEMGVELNPPADSSLPSPLRLALFYAPNGSGKRFVIADFLLDVGASPDFLAELYIEAIKQEDFRLVRWLKRKDVVDVNNKALTFVKDLALQLKKPSDTQHSSGDVRLYNLYGDMINVLEGKLDEVQKMAKAEKEKKTSLENLLERYALVLKPSCRELEHLLYAAIVNGNKPLIIYTVQILNAPVDAIRNPYDDNKKIAPLCLAAASASGYKKIEVMNILINLGASIELAATDLYMMAAHKPDLVLLLWLKKIGARDTNNYALLTLRALRASLKEPEPLKPHDTAHSLYSTMINELEKKAQ